MNMMKKNIKRSLFLIIFVSLVIMSVTVCVAGGNSKAPLKLEESFPSDNEKSVSTDLKEIKLVFSKNVVNMKVKEENMNCFEMYDNQNNKIVFDIIMADDQIDREKRNDVILVPKEPLREDTIYTIIVNENLKSKSGVSLGEEVRISFSTKGVNSKLNLTLIISGIVVVVVILLFILRKAKK